MIFTNIFPRAPWAPWATSTRSVNISKLSENFVLNDARLVKISKPLVTSAYSDVWDEAFEDTEDLCKTCGETVDKNIQYYCPTCGEIL